MFKQNTKRVSYPFLADNSMEDQYNIADDFAEDNATGEISHILIRKIFSKILFLLKSKRFIKFAAIIIVFGVISYGAYEKYFNLTDAERAQKELAAAIAGASKLMILPEGDEPALATVTDAEALIKQQTFFAGSVNGDQLLLFPKNMKAVIWSPSREKIVNAGPIQQSPENQESIRQLADKNQESEAVNTGTGINSAVPSISELVLAIEVRNGTGKPGLATQIADQISADKNYNISKIGDTEKKDYAKTIVVIRSGNAIKNQLASSLASNLKADILSDIPAGEKDTEADALVILGFKE